MEKRIFTLLVCLALVTCSQSQHYAATPLATAKVNKRVKIFLKNLEIAVDGMDTYRCVMTTQNWKGSRYEYKVSRLYFKKPNLMRLEVLKGEKRGSRVILDKEGRIRGKNSLGIGKVLQPTDDRIKNLRGYTFLNSSLLDKVERIKRDIFIKEYKAVLKEKRWGGRPAYNLHIYHNNPKDPVTNEEIWFDKKTYAILKNIEYEGDKKAADVTWQDFEINIPLDDALFDL